MNKWINTTINEVRLKGLKKILKNVVTLSEQYADLSDEALQNKTVEFRKRLGQGETLDQLMPEAYAVCREASRRVLGMYPKEVQILGAIVMHQGNIAEMQTGEGKTLTATMPMYLNGLKGIGNFLVTTNDYLAKRDYLEMKPLYEFLGLTVNLGFVDEPNYDYKPGEKKALYEADIVYTTNGILGFDYLIDNLADHIKGKFLSPLKYALIDEIDSIILDAAQTPLVISGVPRVQSNLYLNAKEFIDTLGEEDYDFEEDEKEIFLTEKGIKKGEHYFNLSMMHQKRYFDIVRMLNLALRAKFLFESNVDYYAKDGEVVLIDRTTGRLLTGTKLQSGLHQAIEAREGVKLSTDLSAMATITFQNLFMQFDNFSGMSATAKLGEREFSDLYSKVVIQIPTDKPVIRQDLEDKVFIDQDSKNIAILEHVLEVHETGRPILLITRTADAAEYFSEFLFQQNIPNNLLIAQNVAKEAQMIKEAGQLGAVTVATSMAGRGTDIKLDAPSLALGGLYVIVNEHMENSRVDRQLRGRSGRQGDPGTSQIYISLEDYLVKKWGQDRLIDRRETLLENKARFEQSKILHKRIATIVKKAQVVSEENAMIARQMSNEFEKSISIQRLHVYQERDRILQSTDFKQFKFRKIAEEVFTSFVENAEKLDETILMGYVYKNISFQYDEPFDDNVLLSKQATVAFLMDLFEKQLIENKSIINHEAMYKEYLQKAILKAVDTAWIKQVDQLTQLKSAVGNRNGHRNVVSEYHKVALESYEGMSHNIYERIVRNICLSIISFDHKGNMIVHFP
ncbi:accessory Sec system translocase SecA2 [Macrococcus sp. DPC7161]|uniref:accessory Sec system translocase SecA2 n=1 Tax=Macrococcus sp. DPC7161 TaxID=2507060 RepID=UPI00100C0E18|nr:accessory Sec system translocase SecA2 [Macrococcus sp. DPC7161]RXK17611.1 accessory Sec system translocase SecA2 [Macrococcus sp. DPC7161]